MFLVYFAIDFSLNML